VNPISNLRFVGRWQLSLPVEGTLASKIKLFTMQLDDTYNLRGYFNMNLRGNKKDGDRLIIFPGPREDD